jgi:hypothetical protein
VIGAFAQQITLHRIIRRQLLTVAEKLLLPLLQLSFMRNSASQGRQGRE